jgi:transcriptional regulator with XRE-family HTH domain
MIMRAYKQVLATAEQDEEAVQETNSNVAGRVGAHPPTENLGLIVGQNMKRLRARRNLTLDALARASGVSRAMLGQIETGRSVPTINVVWKIAAAFDIPFATLISTPSTDKVHVFPAQGARVLTSASGDFTSRALFPFDGQRRAEFYELRLKAHGVELAEPHALGTMENLIVSHGRLDIEIGSQTRQLGPGDAILFQADRPHAYKNPTNEETVAYLVMTYVDQPG